MLGFLVQIHVKVILREIESIIFRKRLNRIHHFRHLE